MTEVTVDAILHPQDFDLERFDEDNESLTEAFDLVALARNPRLLRRQRLRVRFPLPTRSTKNQRLSPCWMCLNGASPTCGWPRNASVNRAGARRGRARRIAAASTAR
jgi:hypothetical protein